MTELPELEEKAREIGRLIGVAMPPGVGFALLLFNFGEGGNLTYISNAQRDTMVEAFREFLSKVEH